MSETFRQIVPLLRETERIAQSLSGKRDGERAQRLLAWLHFLHADGDEARQERDHLTRMLK